MYGCPTFNQSPTGILARSFHRDKVLVKNHYSLPKFIQYIFAAWSQRCLFFDSTETKFEQWALQQSRTMSCVVESTILDITNKANARILPASAFPRLPLAFKCLVYLFQIPSVILKPQPLAAGIVQACLCCLELNSSDMQGTNLRGVTLLGLKIKFWMDKLDIRASPTQPIVISAERLTICKSPRWARLWEDTCHGIMFSYLSVWACLWVCQCCGTMPG